MSDDASTVRYRATIALVLALAALGLTLGSWVFHRPAPRNGTTSTSGPGLLDRIERTGQLHAGYGVYPPYTQEDPNTKKVSGYSVDVIEEIAKELKCTVVWHRLNWTTMSADLKRGEFDVIADPIFQTIPRAREFAFTQPYAFFADGIAVVRKRETRFSDFDSLDRPGVTIAVGQGWASETLVRTRFTKATIQSTQTSTDLLQVFNDVLAGRADVAVADGADAERFVKEHPDAARALFLDKPPAFMPAGLALRPDDRAGAEFLSVSLRNLQSTGVLDALARKYQITARGPQG
jgi:ABC-type amino acid transport substrate-binding protein